MEKIRELGKKIKEMFKPKFESPEIGQIIKEYCKKKNIEFEEGIKTHDLCVDLLITSNEYKIPIRIRDRPPRKSDISDLAGATCRLSHKYNVARAAIIYANKNAEDGATELAETHEINLFHVDKKNILETLEKIINEPEEF